MPVGEGKLVANEAGTADVYVRPHELDVARSADGGNALRAKVVHVNPAGSVVKVRCVADDFGLVVNVDLSPDRYRALGIKTGDVVFVSPKAAKIFEPEYAI